MTTAEFLAQARRQRIIDTIILPAMYAAWFRAVDRQRKMK